MTGRTPAALAVAALLALAACRTGGRDLSLVVKSDFEGGTAEGWIPNDPAHWRVADDKGSRVYELTAPGTPGPVRAPTSLSVLAGHDVA
ncbi:MAG: hypothetical protein ACXWGZ_05090, partial [Candidatus Aminicenantales bacterium]